MKVLVSRKHFFVGFLVFAFVVVFVRTLLFEVPPARKTVRTAAATKTPSVVFVTSTMGRYHNSMRYKSNKPSSDLLLAARLPHYNLLSASSLKNMLNHTLRIYTEDTYDIMHRRPAVKRHPHGNIQYVDLFVKYSWLAEFCDDPNNSIQKFYKSGTGTSSGSASALGLFRKTLAVYDAVHGAADGSLVVWLDMDTFFQNEISDDVFNFLKKADVSYIPMFNIPSCVQDFPFLNNSSRSRSCGVCAETGIVSYIVSPATRRVLQGQVDWVLREALLNQERCSAKRFSSVCVKMNGICDYTTSLNDIAVFGNAMYSSLGILTQQFLATGCLYSKDGNWTKIAKYYKVGAYMLCPGDPNTSKFNILKYIMHFKGTTTGLAKRRSLWSSHEPGPKISFSKSVAKHGSKLQKLGTVQ